jgi:hypothetical protein
MQFLIVCAVLGLFGGALGIGAWLWTVCLRCRAWLRRRAARKDKGNGVVSFAWRRDQLRMRRLN